MKTNIKHYSEKTKQSLFAQLHSLIPEKHNGLQNIVDVCEDIITKGDDNMQYWFINVFSRIIVYIIIVFQKMLDIIIEMHLLKR